MVDVWIDTRPRLGTVSGFGIRSMLVVVGGARLLLLGYRVMTKA